MVCINACVWSCKLGRGILTDSTAEVSDEGFAEGRPRKVYRQLSSGNAHLSHPFHSVFDRPNCGLHGCLIDFAGVALRV
jgi:hypothetical protein